MILKKYLLVVYSLWAMIYDSFVDPRYYFDRNKAIEKLKIKPGEKILEVGIGTGLNLPYYPDNCSIYGIDFSESMLDKARQNKTKENIILKNMDASDMRFPDKFFDKVLMTYALRVTPNPKKVLNEVRRVLKPKGRLLIVDQFKTKNSFFLMLSQPIRILMGSGRDYFVENLIDNTFTIKSKEQFGIKKRTQLLILNRK